PARAARRRHAWGRRHRAPLRRVRPDDDVVPRTLLASRAREPRDVVRALAQRAARPRVRSGCDATRPVDATTGVGAFHAVARRSAAAYVVIRPSDEKVYFHATTRNQRSDQPMTSAETSSRGTRPRLHHAGRQ